MLTMKRGRVQCNRIIIVFVITVITFCGSISGPVVIENRQNHIETHLNPIMQKLQTNNIKTGEENEFLKKILAGTLNEINSRITKGAHNGREYLQRLIASQMKSSSQANDRRDFKATFVDSVMREIWRKNQKRQTKSIQKWDSQKSPRLGRVEIAPAPTTVVSSTLPPIFLENFEIFQIPSDIFLQTFVTAPPTFIKTTTEKPTLEKYLTFDQFLSTQANPSFWSTPSPPYKYSSKSIQSGKLSLEHAGISTAAKVDKSFQPSYGLSIAQPQPPHTFYPSQGNDYHNNYPNSNILTQWSKPDTKENQNQVIQSVPGNNNWEPSQNFMNTNSNTQNVLNQNQNQGQRFQNPNLNNVEHIPNLGKNFGQQTSEHAFGGFLNNNQHNLQPNYHHQEQFQHQNFQPQPPQVPPHDHPNTHWTPHYPSSNSNDNSNSQNHQFNDFSTPSFPANDSVPTVFPPYFTQTPQHQNNHQYGWLPKHQQYNANENFNAYNNNFYHQQQPHAFGQHYHQHNFQNYYPPPPPPPPPPKYEDNKESSDEDKDKDHKSHKGFFHNLHKAVFGDKKNKHKDKDKEQEPNYGWSGWSGWSGWPGWSNDNNYNNNLKENDKGSNENNDAVTSFSDTYDHYSKKASGWWDKAKQKLEDHFNKKAHDKHHNKKKSLYSVTQKIYGISISILSFLAFGAYILMLLFQSAVTYLTFPLLSGIISLLSGEGPGQLVQFFVGRSLMDNPYNEYEWWHQHSYSNNKNK